MLLDPVGFREIVAANPLLFTGVYVVLALGSLLFLLGFLGCCGAIRENKCLLLLVSHLRWNRAKSGVFAGGCHLIFEFWWSKRSLYTTFNIMFPFCVHNVDKSLVFKKITLYETAN